MKLIVTIPALNEEENIADVIREIPRVITGVDQVEVLVVDDGSTDRTVEIAKAAGADSLIRHKTNLGLAKTFRDGLDEALKRGADIIVNTDGDNHYDQSKIPDLVQPILEQRADIVLGSRKVKELAEMPAINKYGNLFGSWVNRKLFGFPPVDLSTGYRAYSREAALRVNVFSNHTYVHTTLLSAIDQKLTIVDIPIRARKVTRKSRLIKSIPKHILHAQAYIVINIVLFRPIRFFGMLAALFITVGFLVVLRFLYLYFTEGGQGHVQSLLLAGVLIIIGFQSIVLGLIASAIGWSRKLQEEQLYRLRKREFDPLSKA
ncbi:MAG: glycosyltransferase family 2 protein [Candidatus Kerfeldbacteria bacterium]|nr:glycosyltransferase family 2 protein [Candidatus Kerfeldbacteria bacterium]